jgi:hypothetical protein
MDNDRFINNIEVFNLTSSGHMEVLAAIGGLSEGSHWKVNRLTSRRIVSIVSMELSSLAPQYELYERYVHR